MPSKQVTRPIVIAILDFYGGKIPFDELISILREAEYCVSEKALADIGFPPKRLRENGHWVSIAAKSSACV
jgi:hypothetical protein